MNKKLRNRIKKLFSIWAKKIRHIDTICKEERRNTNITTEIKKT
jgi:hypothetical protein